MIVLHHNGPYTKAAISFKDKQFVINNNVYIKNKN